MCAVRRRSLVYVAAWFAATSFGVAISWAGVRGVLYTAALPQPPAVSVPTEANDSPPGPAPSTTPSRTATPATGATAAARPSRSSGSPKPSKTAHTPRPSGGKVKSFTLRGGHVALAFYPHRIRLISATPDPGWETNVWDDRHAGWLRVEFHRDDHTSSIFGIWNNGTPHVQFYNR